MNFVKVAIFCLVVGLLLIGQPVGASQTTYNSHYVFLPKAEVIGVDEGSLQVLSDDNLYTVKLGGIFGIYSRWWSGLTAQELATGHVMQILGRQVDNDLIEAKLARDISLQKKLSALLGTVEKYNEPAGIIYLQTKMHGLVEVVLSSQTVIIDPKSVNQDKKIKVGKKLVVKGLWDKANSRMTEVNKIVLFHLGETKEK
ncbi:hypothetical protein KKC17_00545 [Patescibacteria group bacterium]|nr:hypothetical protein [Patescibacteria group bacterium]